MQEDLTTFDKFKELKKKYIEEIQNQQIEALTDEDIENIKAMRNCCEDNPDGIIDVC